MFKFTFAIGQSLEELERFLCFHMSREKDIHTCEVRM